MLLHAAAAAAATTPASTSALLLVCVCVCVCTAHVVSHAVLLDRPWLRGGGVA